MLNYPKFRDLLTDEAVDFTKKWPIIVSNLQKFNITLLDLLKVMPSSASAQVVVGYQRHYFKVVKIFEDSLPDKNGIFVSFKGFSDTDPNMPYKSLRMGEFEGAEELGTHCFIMNEILPRGLFSLIASGKTDLNSVFFTLLNFDEFLLVNLRPNKGTERAQAESQGSTADEYWIRNTITLIRKLDYFIRKAYTKQKSLFEETRAFLLNYRTKIDEDAISCLNFFVALKSELRNSIDYTLTAMENIERNNFDNFNRIILSQLKAKTFVSIDTRINLEEASADFEKDYPNKAIAIQYLRKQLNNPEFLFETVENIGKRLDRIFLARRTDKMSLFQEIVSLLRFNDLLIFEVSLVDERYSLLTRIILWRLFSFCLYSEYAPIVLGYIIRQFKVLGPKIDKQHQDYIYSLFCYLYVMDKRRVCEKLDRSQENKKVVLTLLEMFLSNTDLKAFCRANFFLRLDFEDESLRKNMNHLIKKNNDLNATFNNICDELIDSKAFRDKSLLIIAFARKVLLNLYINPQNNENDQDSKLRLYATLMLLFDMSELQKIDKKINPHNYLLVETRLKLIIECFGLIGAYPRSESRKINEVHLNSENPALSPLDKDSRPTDLIKFLQTYVEKNMFYKNINLFAVFKTLQRAELATQDIQHSQLFYEKVNLDSAGNSIDMIKWICKLAITIQTEFYFAFDMTLEILIGSENDLGFILIPFILYIYLQNCNEDHINGLTADINKILDKGVSLHKMILINTIKQLEKWHFESLQYLQSTQQSQADKKGVMKKATSRSHKVDDTAIKIENFCNHFTQIKKLIDMNKLIKAQADFGDYKSAALNLEKLLEYMITPDNQINDTECVEKLGLLYSIYAEINEEYKDISFENILQKLRIVYDPSKIPLYVSQITKKPNTINPVKGELIYNDEKSALISDSDIEAMTYIFSRKKVPLNDDSIFFSLLASVLSLSCHLMGTAPEYTTMLEELKAQAEEIFSNAKLSLIFSLLMIKNNYHSLYPFFLKAQILMDFEILFKVFRYTCRNASKINPNLVQSMTVERENFDISLDEMNDHFFMHTPPNEDIQFKIILFMNTCLTRIEKRLKTFEANYKLKFDWMNIIKFIINLMRENVKYYFDSIYFKFLYKLLKLTYGNNDYSRAEIYHKRLIHNVDVLRRPTKCRFLLAKLTRKLKGKKDAIKILNEIKIQDSSEKIFEIKAKLRIAKYMQAFYAEADVDEKYRHILSQYNSTCKNEVMYFKYAKFLEEINPNLEVEKAVEIVKYYLESIKYGHEYIFQSLPRALRIWLDYCLPGLATKSSKKTQLQMKINQIVYKVLTELETYKLVHIIQFLVSRLDNPDDDVVEILIQCLSRIAQEYPRQSVWWLLPLKYFNFKDPKGDYGRVSRQERAMKILNNVKKLNVDSWRIINDADPFYKGLLDFAVGKDSIPPVLLQEMKNSNIIMPLRKYLDPILPKKNSVPDPHFNPFHPQPKYIQNMEPKFVTMQSKEKPKRITFKCTDGTRIPFLIKYEPKGDVRKESRTIDYVNFVNLYLQNSTLVKDKSFKMKSFSIIPLCSRLNLSEWVDNTATIKSIIEKEWKSNGIKNTLSEIFHRFQINESRLPSRVWEEVYRSKLVFHYFFWNNFGDPNDWYDASLSYVKTTALWSAFGYLIGLGDRHCDNILLDKGTGEMVHIDFDCIFHKGKHLPVPEVVEFRLTRNIEAPMGAFKCYGLYEYYFKVACKVFQKNVDDLLGALDSFVHDPLLENMPHFRPSQTLEKIRKRVMFSQNKSLEEGIHQIVEDSKNEECLKEMFSGWMPYM